MADEDNRITNAAAAATDIVIVVHYVEWHATTHCLACTDLATASQVATQSVRADAASVIHNCNLHFHNFFRSAPPSTTHSPSP